MEIDFEMFKEFQKFMAMSAKTTPKTRRIKGTGSVTVLSGNRRRRYIASVTTGYDEFTGNQKQSVLAYFETRAQAEKALDIYILEKEGRCPSGTLNDFIKDVNASLPKNKVSDVKITRNKNVPTVQEIWDILQDTVIKEKSKGTRTQYASNFNHLSVIFDRPINDIKLSDIQPIFDNLKNNGLSKTTANITKVVLSLIFEYAVRYDYVEKNYANLLYISDGRSKNEIEAKKKTAISPEEIKVLFANDDDVYAKCMLFMIYTGMRPNELLKLDKESVKDGYIIGGSKTKAGTNRVIPIHPCIEHYTDDICSLSMKYNTFREKTRNTLKRLGIKDYTPHCGRHTFATLCYENEVDDLARKKIMGHASKDLTNDVYTHVKIERLKKEIKKLPDLR